MGLFDWLRKRADPQPDASAEGPGLSTVGASPGAGQLPTPLSDLMTQVLQDGSDEAWRTFCDAFMRARVGVVASDLPAGADDETAAGPIAQTPPDGGWYRVQAGQAALGRAATPDVRIMILACADRDAFVLRFHDRFNREVLGWELAQVALVTPGCDGILLNSAASFNSLVLDRARLANLVVQQQ